MEGTLWSFTVTPQHTLHAQGKNSVMHSTSIPGTHWKGASFLTSLGEKRRGTFVFGAGIFPLPPLYWAWQAWTFTPASVSGFSWEHRSLLAGRALCKGSFSFSSLHLNAHQTCLFSQLSNLRAWQLTCPLGLSSLSFLFLFVVFFMLLLFYFFYLLMKVIHMCPLSFSLRGSLGQSGDACGPFLECFQCVQ